MADARCIYMCEAYPEMSAEDLGCGFGWGHLHVPAVFTLAWMLAELVHEEEVDVEKTAWFLEDAQNVVYDLGVDSDFVDWTVDWSQLDVLDAMVINGIEYVVQDADFEPSTLVRREEWMSDRDD